MHTVLIALTTVKGRKLSEIPTQRWKGRYKYETTKASDHATKTAMVTAAERY